MDRGRKVSSEQMPNWLGSSGWRRQDKAGPSGIDNKSTKALGFLWSLWSRLPRPWRRGIMHLDERTDNMNTTC
jgi:hypothetical protein